METITLTMSGLDEMSSDTLKSWIIDTLKDAPLTEDGRESVN